MKRVIQMMIIAALAMSMAGCAGKNNGKPAGNGNTVQNVIDQQMQNNDQGTAEKEQASISLANGEYDVDLTMLSSTMVYSQVYDMMVNPEDYIGKKVRMTGPFTIYQNTDEKGQLIPDEIYFACVIADATACCAQGLEFVLAGDYAYPDDYPELGEEIVVSGIFDTYKEYGTLYCHLTEAVME